MHAVGYTQCMHAVAFKRWETDSNNYILIWDHICTIIKDRKGTTFAIKYPIMVHLSSHNNMLKHQQGDHKGKPHYTTPDSQSPNNPKYYTTNNLLNFFLNPTVGSDICVIYNMRKTVNKQTLNKQSTLKSQHAKIYNLLQLYFNLNHPEHAKKH
jgi:hypothetical protein